MWNAEITSSWLAGFTVCLSLIVSIGAQNVYVLRQAVRGEHTRACVAWCVGSDALLIGAGVAGMHIEDQVSQKRCGHRPNKEVVSTDEMVDRVKAAVDAKTDADFVVMARTDALQVEGLNGVIDRACAFIEAGADAIFAEAMTDITMYKQICDAVKAPVLANLTEFGTTPYYMVDELGAQGIAMVLYPLSPTRAMQRAALNVMEAIRKEGTQKNVLDLMQPRSELYDFLGYHAYEDKLDQLFKKGK
jgi:methylisocitrate lyase